MPGFYSALCLLKTIYFVLYCNLLVVLWELRLDGVHIGAIPKFHRFTNGEGDRAFGGIQDLFPMVQVGSYRGTACVKWTIDLRNPLI